MLLGRIRVTDTPSKDWRPEERILVAAHIIERLAELNETSHIPREEIADVSERLIAVLTETSNFLENNRITVLEGRLGKPSLREIEK